MIDFQALDMFGAMPQPIRGYAGSRPDLEDRFAQVDPIERPGQDLAFYRTLPMTGFAVPTVESIHIASRPALNAMERTTL
jgi:hypothetical protein